MDEDPACQCDNPLHHDSPPALPLTEMEIEMAREGHTYRNARWLATIDSLLSQ